MHFFEQAKRNFNAKAEDLALDDEGEDEIGKQPMMNKEYYKTVATGFEVPIPTFAKVSKNILFLAENRLSTGMA